MTSRAVVTTEAPTAPVLLSLYAQHGHAGRIELSPRDALALALDLFGCVMAKLQHFEPADGR